MKKEIITTVMLAFAFAASADIIPIPVEIGKKPKDKPTPPPVDSIHRIPFRLVIEAEYDNEQHGRSCILG